jgi:hypothetical protein
MKTCYVSMPLGIKPNIAGRMIDFDRVYFDLVKPAVSDAGLQCVRGDELRVGALISKAVLSAVLSSDVMLADVGTADANVMYELGVRHALRRGVTILLNSGPSPVPFNISHSQIVYYEAGDDIARVAASRETIHRAVVNGLRAIEGDSPLFEVFPDLRVELPADLVSEESKRRIYPEKIRNALRKPGKPRVGRERIDEVLQAESAAKATPGVDPAVYLNLLREYRDASAWDEMVRMAETLPPEVAKDPQVIQLVALALNRRGDHERAISKLTELINETGGDAESFGILGRIYKDLYRKSGRSEHWHGAVENYRKGFEKQPTDFYTGLNVVTLLAQNGGTEAIRQMESLLPRVQQALNQTMQDDRAGDSEIAAALQLACLARQWDRARNFVSRIARAPKWIIESALHEIQTIMPGMDEAAKSELRAIIEMLEADIN